MHLIALVKAMPTDPEIAILRISNQEHDDLHKDPLGFVNRNHVFGRDISRVDMQPHPSEKMGATQLKASAKTEAAPNWLVVIPHLPKCTASATCITV